MDILKYAKDRNAIVLTNNIKDFEKQGITTISVRERLKAKTEIPNLIKAIKNINSAAGKDLKILNKGNKVSAAQYEKIKS